MSLRLVFMGTPAFGVPLLETLHASAHTLVAVYCQAPEPAGRGMQLRKCAVQEWAEAQGIPVYTPSSFKKIEVQAEFAALKPDAAIVAAYGMILPQAALDIPRHGCINIHASLLPRWRGAAPIQRAIQAGDSESGVCIMQMEAGLDTGPVWLRGTVPITASTTASTLHDALAAQGAQLILPALDKVITGARLDIQSEVGVTYAKKIEKAEAELDFTKTAKELDCHIRAFTPWPGAWFMSQGQRIKVHQAVPQACGLNTPIAPRTMMDGVGLVACGGNSALRLQVLQREGKKPQPADEFFRGFNVAAGEML